mgnify:CR=1 FL=1
MAKIQIKHIFPGGNTPEGFFSYYKYIIPADGKRIFLIKGGPGTGKSTFMKKIGAEMVARGYSVEHHHCSSDPNSLDGLVIPSLNVALMDGTAPHIVDPQNPGCVDEIIHLGDFWDEPKLVSHKKDIIACNHDISQHFQRAYRTLQAAKSFYHDWKVINSNALRHTTVNEKTSQLMTALFTGVDTIGSGKIRKLFASAITPDGSIHYLPSIIDTMPRRFVIAGQPGTGKSTLMQRLLDTAVFKGLDTEAYYCPLDPRKLEHLLIPALGIAVTTSAVPHNYIPANTESIIDMNDCLTSSKLMSYQDELAYDQAYFGQHFQQAIVYIKKAKQLHDVLETYYVPYMNFAGVQQVWEKTLRRILIYSQE